MAGHAFTLDLKADERVHFLHYNSRNDSIKIEVLTDYGFVACRAKSLQNRNTSSLSKLIEGATETEKWEFEETDFATSLTIDQQSVYFCAECYFLIKITAQQTTAVSLILHSSSSAFPLKENTYIKETLGQGEAVKYTLLKLAPFKLAFAEVLGRLSVAVTLSNNATYRVILDISESGDYLIPYEGLMSAGNNIYDSNSFLIDISCKEGCSYSMLTYSTSEPRKLMEGVPYRFLSSQADRACFQFASLAGNHSTHLLFVSGNISNTKYGISCVNITAPGPCEANP